jgi:histidine triad (HIT) family protein
MQNSKAMAFLDAFPLALGHTLVVPKKHSQKIQDMQAAEAQAVFEIVYKIAEKVEVANDASASLVAIHNGRDAGQEISHVHVHIVPRKPGDGAGPVHSMFEDRPKLSAQEMDAILGKMVAEK